MNTQRLAGKVAIITGGSRGIGKGIAERFCAEGACVVLCAFNDDEQMQQTVTELCDRYPAIGQRAVGFNTNVADTDAVIALFEFALAAYPQIDILVNNAGIQAVTTGADFDPAVMKRILDVNLYGPAICSREAIRHFLSRPGGGVLSTTPACIR